MPKTAAEELGVNPIVPIFTPEPTQATQKNHETGDILPIDPRSLSTQNEAVAIRDKFIGVIADLKLVLGGAIYETPDQLGRKDWVLVSEENDFKKSVGNLLYVLKNSPGSSLVHTLTGGVDVVGDVPKVVLQGAPDGSLQANPNATKFLGMDPGSFDEETQAILAAIKALDDKWSGK